MKFLILAALLAVPTIALAQSSDKPARAKAAANRVVPSLTNDLAAAGLELGNPVFIRAFKDEKVLEVFVKDAKTGQFKHFRSYPIVAASGKLGPKLAQGDRQVPEGFYFVNRSRMNPHSRFHLAFNIGYPNAYDRHHKRTGNYIMVHGNRVSIGCLAMTDAKIEEIYTLCDAALDQGQAFFRIHIFPFRMTDARMKKAADSKWISYWRDLKPGYDWFEKHNAPPNTTVKSGRYVFGAK